MTDAGPQRQPRRLEPLQRLLRDYAWAARDRAAAKAALGSDHRLVRTLTTLSGLRRQLVITTIVLIASPIALAAGAPHATTLIAAALIVELLLTASIGVLHRQQNTLVRDCIAEGRDDLPLRIFTRERQRLTSPDTQHRLGRALRTLVESAEPSPAPRGAARSAVDVRLIQTASRQLIELAQLLDGRSAPTRAVARLEQLLESTTSQLHGDRLHELLDDLMAVRHQFNSWSDDS